MSQPTPPTDLLPPAMRVCPQCGASRPITENFCPACGGDGYVQGVRLRPTAREQLREFVLRSTPFVAMGAGFLFLVSLLFVCFAAIINVCGPPPRR